MPGRDSMVKNEKKIKNLKMNTYSWPIFVMIIKKIGFSNPI